MVKVETTSGAEARRHREERERRIHYSE